MNFLSPLTIALAAGLTIPPLVALYFLKLKRDARVVPSTLLWKRAVEDLHVNSPFQRLRKSLLLLLQLLVLIAAALALGKPMLQTAETHRSTAVLIIDQSASMGVVEADSRTRLEHAKEQAKSFLDNLDPGARAMVIALSDRATVVSAFDTDVRALKHKIDTIEQTQSTTSLGEALSLAEAYTQNMIIALKDQPDIEMTSDAPPATVAFFTDGNVEDAAQVTIKKLDTDNLLLFTIGKRDDNVGLLSMDARRSYDHPEILQVAAAVRNFGRQPVTVDAVVYVDGVNMDVQTVSLGAAKGDATDSGDQSAVGLNSQNLIVFDEIEFEGGGLVEVALRVDDALPVDDRAWTIINEPRHTRVLLVTDDNMFLEDALDALPFRVERMTGRAYEAAPDDKVLDGERSAYDVVIFDGHSTDRLPPGNYFFWGAVPNVDGVTAGTRINNEVIFNWDDTHPILRYVAVETLQVYEWQRLTLPSDAVSLIEGETSSVLAYLARDGRQYLMCAFRLITYDDSGQALFNTYWGTTVDFLVFIQNSVQYLSSNIAITGLKSVRPGAPVTLPIPADTTTVKVLRPDKREDRIPVAGYPSVHYADTRVVGPYTIEPGVKGQDAFAVNLFNQIESDVRPQEQMTIGADAVTAKASRVEVNRPAWPYFLIAMLVLLLLEWVVYNKRVFV